MTNNLPIPPRSPEVARYLDHYFKPAMTQGSGGMGRLIFALDATARRQQDALQYLDGGKHRVPHVGADGGLYAETEIEARAVGQKRRAPAAVSGRPYRRAGTRGPAGKLLYDATRIEPPAWLTDRVGTWWLGEGR
jgi:hypothetical protein